MAVMRAFWVVICDSNSNRVAVLVSPDSSWTLMTYNAPKSNTDHLWEARDNSAVMTACTVSYSESHIELTLLKIVTIMAESGADMKYGVKC